MLIASVEVQVLSSAQIETYILRKMQILAHRGWNMDINKQTNWSENSLSAFDLAQSHPDITGVEIDIRRHPTTGKIVLSHDPIVANMKYLTLDKALEVVSKQNWQTVIEFKEYDRGLFDEVANLVNKYNLCTKSTLFAFGDIAQNFPWQKRQKLNLGIIAEYPWQIAQTVRTYQPDTLLLGWDERPWTFIAFATWWSIFDLRKVTKKYNIQLVAGVAQSTSQLNWARKIGVTTITADMQLIR